MSTPPLRTRRLRTRVAGAAALWGIGLSLYFGVVHAFSFSPPSSPSAKGINAAIVVMDVVLAAHLAGGALARLRRGGRAESDRRVPLGWLLSLLAAASLAGVTALHGDYLLARSGGLQSGIAGSLVTIKVLLLAAQCASLLFLRLGRSRPASLGAAIGLFAPGWQGLALLSVVLIPLANYLAHNRDLFTAVGVAEYLAVFLLPPVSALALLRFFERSYGAGVAAAPLVAGLALLSYSMPLLCAVLRRPVEALFPVHAALALGLPAALAAAYAARPRAMTKGIALVTVCSVAASLLQVAFPSSAGEPQPASVRREKPREPSPAALSARARRTPDVYLLVYDGYASPASLRERGRHDAWEADHLGHGGFTVYHRAYSLFLASRASMGSLMNMGGPATSEGIGGDNASICFFQEHGYQVNLVLNSYLLQGSNRMAADLVFPPWSWRSGLRSLYRGIAGGEFKSEIVFGEFERDTWLTAKRRVLSTRSGGPRMLYAHSAFPGHSQNSGTCLPDETERYLARLAVAREEIRGDIEAIDRSGREAIVIVAGDHGPYLTGDCLYLQNGKRDDLTASHLADRYGTLLAIRWPGRARPATDRIEVLQDVFRAMSAYLLDHDGAWEGRPPAVTVGYGGIPDGAVSGGVVMVGRDAGRPLVAE